ncbi:uncharacterized protein LOC111106807 [Crassostrea virginica]
MGFILSKIFGDKDDSHGQEENSSENGSDCTKHNFNNTECHITTRGKLVLVLDSMNQTLHKQMQCFSHYVCTRMMKTNMTIEVLNGENSQNHVNLDELRKKLSNLSSEFNPKENEAGMAVILSDRRLTSANFSYMPDDREPFLYIVNIGHTEEEEKNSCYRQHRSISEMRNISFIGQEMESIGCNGGEDYMQANCPQRFTTPISKSSFTFSSTGGKTHMQENSSHFLMTPSPKPTTSPVVGTPLIILSVLGALVLAILIILYLIFRPKCHKRGKAKRNTFMESSAGCRGFDGYPAPRNRESRPSLEINDVYNVLWEKERRRTDTQDNYHHIDIRFAHQTVDTSLYDVAGAKPGELDDDVFKSPD